MMLYDDDVCNMQTVMSDAWINIGYTDCLLSPYQPPSETLNTSLLGISPVLALSYLAVACSSLVVYSIYLNPFVSAERDWL